MKAADKPGSLRTPLIVNAIVWVGLPVCLFGLRVLYGPSGAYDAWGSALLLLSLAGIAVNVILLLRLIRIRFYDPLRYFRSTLEDISEGFILDRIPEDPFRKAEPGITEAFRQVIHINRMLLKNVDSLEQGFEEERQAKLAQQSLTDAYQRFVPKDFISFLQKSKITEVRLGDHVQTEMTILVSDIRSFTSMSEGRTPEENFRLINSYLYVMEPVVNEHHGFIDKYMGDSIMALFPRSPDNAVRAALRMLEKLRDFNRRRSEAGEEPLAIGVGLNTGSVMLGIVGGENRMEGTVIGDAVNLAARMEELNKRYGTSLLISEHTYQRLTDPSRFAIMPVDRVRVKGKTEALHIYEVTGEVSERDRSAHDSHEAGETI